jgi:hypothetical protein
MLRLNHVGRLTRQLVCILSVVVLWDAATAEARIRGGGGGFGGGARVSARTTYRPAVGVTRSVTATSRYHRPVVNPGVRPGYRPYVPGTVNGVARRTARRTVNRAMYRTAYGTSYYYGNSVSVLPSACYMTYWEGISAYNCGGYMYVYENGVYYPISGV